MYKEHFGNSARNLIFIGRLTPVKKIDLLIEALLILKQSGLQYNLTLVGGGIQEASLKELVEQKYLNDNVWFYGACYDEIKNAELIYNADLCVSPGNVGLTAIHSMMFGTPVITHSCFKFQMPEFEAIHEGLTGSFFDYDSASSIADCIVRWDKKYIDKREEVRLACFNEIDKFWTPQFQLEIIKTNLKFK
ncbi:glycosyltransferase [Bacteroides sp. BFG-257]|nr:glycosyltransferase [Bacteroides sp. BFG-257]